MSGFRSRRSLRTALDSYWLIPTLYVLLALGLAIGLMRWDESDPVELATSIDANSAADALSALAAGMLGFTGFVTSIVLLVIQFGSVEFSPRLLRWFRRDQTLKLALSTFIATFLFALVATTQVGRGSAGFVPTRTLIAALVLTLLSVAMFLVLIDRTANGLRVANVAQRLDVAAHRVFDSVYPQTAVEVRAAEATVRSLDAVAAVQVIRNGPVGCILVAIDREALAGLAGTNDCVIELIHAVGDHVPAEHVLASVYGPAPLSERSLRRAIVLGDERTLDDDPAFAIRMFVDIAIRALSPAVNDPTTAVQVLGRIEDLLRYAAPKHLSIGVVTDGAGTTRLIYPVTSWDDLVELALSEIRNCAARQLQVTRRLRALLETLLEDVPAERRPALQRQLLLLDDLVAETFPAEQRATALVADRQGLGMSRDERGRERAPLVGSPPVARRYRYPRAAVASPHYLASSAGLAVLADGGNALDAAIATNLVLGVVTPYLCGFGGDVFAIVWDGDLHGYLGSGRSAAATSLGDTRARHGDAMPVFGAETVTVPGGPRGWFDLLERFGSRSFGDLAARALAYARDGFEVSASAPFDESRMMYRKFDDWRAVYGDVTEGTVLRQPAMARTIEALADGGPDAYYGGPIADAIVATVGAGGGALAAGDLAAHQGEWVAPLRARYRDVEVAELPPPTQGTAALEALRILNGFDLGSHDPVAREHLRIEVTKQAMADRDHWITDPDHMAADPADLLADVWVDARRAAVDPAHAGTPDPARSQPGGTAYLCACDDDGLRVSLIQSNFIHFGSGVHVPEWGINLNNRGFSFTLDADRANALAPSKRPMHTLIPAMALRDGEPWLVFGSMGGDAQVGVHVQALSHVLDDGFDPADAIAAPRWRLDVGSWAVKLESRAPDELRDGLTARGHDVTTTTEYDSGMGHAHAIWDTPGGYGATSDPRAESAALGL